MAYFRPENTPNCVLSEQRLLNSNRCFTRKSASRKPKFDSPLYNANKEYQENQFNYLIDKYLDVDCDDDILFMTPVGDKETDDKFSLRTLPKLIEKKFCLLKKIESCEVAPREHAQINRFFSPISLDDKFEFVFSNHPGKKYDKIIIKNCLQFFDKYQKYFCAFIYSLLKNVKPVAPSLLVIQRVNDVSTLPFHQQVYNEWAKADIQYLSFVETMKRQCFSVRFNIETIKCYVDCKSQWYSNLQARSIYPLDHGSIVSQEYLENSGLLDGIRELDEGIFKYQENGNDIEISDRMLFIGGTLLKPIQPSISEQVKAKQQQNQTYNSQLDYEINDEIKDILYEIRPQCKTNNKSIHNYMGKRLPKPKPSYN